MNVITLSTDLRGSGRTHGRSYDVSHQATRTTHSHLLVHQRFKHQRRSSCGKRMVVARWDEMGGVRSHVKHLLQHIPVHPLEATPPPVEVEGGFARRDRSRTVVVLELGGKVEASTTADELFAKVSMNTRPLTVDPRTSASASRTVSRESRRHVRRTHSTLGPGWRRSGSLGRKSDTRRKRAPAT